MTILVHIALIFLFVFGLILANRIYSIDKNIFLYRITAMATLCGAVISFIEYELSRQTNYEIALDLSSLHTMINSVAISFSVMSIWIFANPFPKEKYPYVNRALFLLNLFSLILIWAAELTGHHMVTTIHLHQVIWQYEFDMDRLSVKLLIIWYTLQLLAAFYSLFQIFRSRPTEKMKNWMARTMIFGTVLFLGMFFFYAFNDPEISTGYYLASPAILLSNAFFAHIYTNFKLFAVQPINAFDNILASMSNLMAIANTEFKITYLNGAARREFNFGENPLPDLTFDDVADAFHVADWEKDAKLIHKLSKGQKITNEYEFKYEDQFLYYQMTFSPVFNDLHIKTGFLVVATNITKLKKSEAKLKHYNLQLKQSNYELERFAYIASHDLKTPLRTITSFLNLIDRHIKQHYQDAVLEEYLKFAMNGSRQMNQLIIDVLEFSKLGRIHNAREDQINLNEVVDAACQALQPVIEEKNAKIHKDQLPSLPGNFLMLKQLFQNLIENGIKYNESKPPVLFIKYQMQDTNYQITVQDNGIGIDEIYSDKVFEMFQRLHTSPEYEGTGIGLAVCKKIVSQLDGSIALKSKKGQGSDFIISIPKP